MPLILAIEPDRRQAAQLTGVIRHHVGAELILADTTEGALVAIGRRVPDLVLVPALLAPQDDAALASALRVIAAAAHVRTLTIPVFSNGISPKKKSGVLAKFGLGREEARTAEGCEPSVFAEQVIAYLKESADERASADDESYQPPAGMAAAPVPESWPATVEKPIVEERAGAAEAPLVVPEANDALVVEAAAESVDAAEEEPVEESIADEEEDASIDLSDELMLLCEPEAGDGADPDDAEEPIEIYSLDLSPEESVVEPPISNIAEFEAALKEPLPPVLEEFWEDEPELGITDPDDAGGDLWMPLSTSPCWPSLHPVATDARPAARPLVVDAAPPAVAAAAETPTSEWIELIESLRLDIERLKNGPARPPSDPPPLRAGAASRSKDKSKPAAKKRQPVQDEWGFFDPEQCGFAALLAKLDEITDATDEHAPPAH